MVAPLIEIFGRLDVGGQGRDPLALPLLDERRRAERQEADHRADLGRVALPSGRRRTS
jgi:hypothetical protein